MADRRQEDPAAERRHSDGGGFLFHLNPAGPHDVVRNSGHWLTVGYAAQVATFATIKSDPKSGHAFRFMGMRFPGPSKPLGRL